MHKLTALPSLLAVFFAPSSLAIGLGHLQLQSALGQPLALEIPIHLGATDQIQLDQMHVALRSGIDAHARDLATPKSMLAASKMVAKLTQSSTGTPVIQIHTQASVDTPYIHLIVDLNTPNGLISKEYTVLLDPPEFAAVNRVNEAIALNQAGHSTQSLAALTQGKEWAQSPQEIQKIQENQEISRTLRTQRTQRTQGIHGNALTQQAKQTPVHAPLQQAAVAVPQQLTNADKPRQLKKRPHTGSWHTFRHKTPAAVIATDILVPHNTQTDTRTAIIDDVEPTRSENVTHYRHPAQALIVQSPQATIRKYGPIAYQETLWSIVQKLRNNHPDVTPLQMQRAIVRTNPDAFVDGNVHTLIAGVTLTIPASATMKATAKARTLAVSTAHRKQTAPAKLARTKKVLTTSTTVTGLADKIKKITTIEVAQINPTNAPVIVTQLASARVLKPANVDAGYVGLARSEPATPRITVDSADSRKIETLPAKFAVHSESAKQDYSALFIAMQREIVETIKRLDALQEGQVGIVNKTTTLETNQQNLQAFLNTKQHQLSQVETRLTELSKQLTGLLGQMHLIQQHNSAIARVNSPHSDAALTSLTGFGLLASGLVGGVWYLRRRQWQTTGASEKHPVLQYNEMNDPKPQSSHDSGTTVAAPGNESPARPGDESPARPGDESPASKRSDVGVSIMDEASHEHSSLISSMLKSAVFAPPLADTDATRPIDLTPKKHPDYADSLPFSYLPGDTSIFKRDTVTVEVELTASKRTA